MNSWKVIPTIVLATVLIFGAGVFTGGLLVNRVKPPAKKVIVSETVYLTNCPVTTVSNLAVKVSPQIPELLTKPFLAKLDEQLKLNSDQHKAVEKIINDGQDDIKKSVKFAKMQMRELLTPEQVKQFDSLFKRASKKLVDTNALVNVPLTNSAPVATPAK